MVPGQQRVGSNSQPTALTIAGFDPGSGAGVTADLLTFARFGIYGISAVTGLTVQSTRGVRRVQAVEPDLLQQTLEELEGDLPADGIKIGMLTGSAQVRVVTEFLKRVRLRRVVPIVLDPVLVSSSGAILLDVLGRDLLQRELLSLVDVITPNSSEASLLAGTACTTTEEAERCAAILAERYPGLVVVITGGHLESPSDLILQQGSAIWIPGERQISRATHGTGCAFSSALLAEYMLRGNWLDAASVAKRFVANAMRTAHPRGAGCGPMNLISAEAGTLK